MQFVNFVSRQSVFVFDMENVEMLMPIVISNSARRHKSCGNLRWWWRDWNESHSRYRLISAWLSRRACERDYALKYNRIDDSKARRDVANKMRECILNLWLISSSDNFSLRFTRSDHSMSEQIETRDGKVMKAKWKRTTRKILQCELYVFIYPEWWCTVGASRVTYSIHNERDAFHMPRRDMKPPHNRFKINAKSARAVTNPEKLRWSLFNQSRIFSLFSKKRKLFRSHKYVNGSCELRAAHSV